MNYTVRVLWEGEVMENENFGDREHSASGYFRSTVEEYRWMDPIDGGVSVQLINGDDVDYETFID